MLLYYASMKRRVIFDFLKEKSNCPMGRILVLTGARQTGKTTVAKHCFADHTYLSIEDPVQRTVYLKLNAAQWKNIYPKAVLDEIQKEPALIESIKSVYDQFPEPRYILMGSSQFLLMEKVKESLAGRCLINELYPLILSELMTKDMNDAIEPSFFVHYTKNEAERENILPFLSMDAQFADKRNAYDFYLQYGGYPALTNEMTEEERWEWLAQYVKTFLERDIRDLASFRDLDSFIKLQRYLANTTANQANFASMAKETGVSIPTVQRYVRYMELSYQTVYLPAWFSNPLKRLVKSPKIHFLDTGVLRAILQKRGILSGNEYESAIIAEIYKQIKTFRLPFTCYHLRTHDGKEIDLLLEAPDYMIAIEIKMTEHVNQTDVRHFRDLQSILNKPLKQCFVLSNDDQTHYFDNNIIAIHAAAFLC